jgi:aerobic carbon-monoxide dehydrogenase large subunit
MSVQKIGQHVVREEDDRLLRGKGRYVSDIKLPGEAQAYVLRSPHAHAKIVAIDIARAKAAPGVLAVITGADIAQRGLGTLRPFAPRKRSNGQPAFACPQPLLCQDRVRYVGDPVAFVVAETLNQAKDAAELIEVGYEPLPAVVTAEEALAPGAPAVHDENPGNEAFFHEGGNKEAVDAAFARAAHLVKHKIVINRITANTMEPRGCLAQYDLVGKRYTIRATVQSAHGTRAAMAGQIFKLPHNRFRVICDNMGGGFGMKGGVYPEYAVALYAAELTGRPVRWTAERSEGVMTDEMSRGSHIETTLALDKDGKFLARGQQRFDRRLFLVRAADHSADRRAGLPRQHLRVPGNPRTGTRGADEYDDHRALSRRRSAGADLRHRDDHRQGRASARHRRGGAAPAQHRAGERDAVHHRDEANL